MIQEIRVMNKHADIKGDELLQEVKRTLGITALKHIRTAKVYRLQGVDEHTASVIAQVLADPVEQNALCNTKQADLNYHIIEVGNKPGVMNPEVDSLFKAARALGVTSLVAADTSWEYYFSGDLTKQELEIICDRLLVNKTVAHVITEKPKNLLIKGRQQPVMTVPLTQMSLDQFKKYAKEQQLFLSDDECETIQSYFEKIGRDPYDAELETIAQTWSEHCSHKTFKAPLIIDGKKKKPLFKRLQQTAELFNDAVVSAFEDNAGTFRFYDGYAIAAKVETHNSPSALEPYGGAATGSGGVFRDIMGTGQGAKVIASTDMFCFAPPKTEQKDIPPGCLHPDYLLRKVVAGVRDYGNRMGIPTNNGSVHFHPDFCAKPTVIVGAYGLLPENRCKKGNPQKGDRIVVVGGKTGRDGIHGATFSSDAMTDKTCAVNATAVQIGNPIEEKRMTDALIAARDADLICAITDCGAGGFSSAIGEMGEKTGVHVTLENAPLKYSGLAPWEIWVSESQERMVCAVAPENVQTFIELCALYNTHATDIGYFTDTKKLVVTYNQHHVCNLDMEFLHDGCPQKILRGSFAQTSSEPINETFNDDGKSWEELFCSVLSHGNVCSKESIARQYDHTVQGMNVIAPYAGLSSHGPQDAAVLTPLYGKPYGLIISHGMNPILNRIDPYKGSMWAITEALANLVSVGGNPCDVALIDNFIWPKPNNEFLWALDRAMDACIDAMHYFELPFISGKDSLSSTYVYPNGDAVHIPPVLCISALGKIPNIAKTVTTDIKKSGSMLLLIGQPDFCAMGGSVYEQVLGTVSEHLPVIDGKKTMHIFKQLHALMQNDLILSCHDVSEGGIAAAIAEMCFGGNKGAILNLPLKKNIMPKQFLFNETAGCFVVEVNRDDYERGCFDLIAHTILGITTDKQSMAVYTKNNLCEQEELFNISLKTLLDSWQQPMQEVF